MLLRQMRYFVAVVENRGFTRAAEQLFVTQSAVSQQISQLEDDLGTRLILRKGHALELTNSGRYFYREAKAVLQRLDNAVDKVADVPSDSGLRLSLYYRGDAIDPIVVPILALLHERHPALEINLMRSKRTTSVLASLNAGEADLAILKQETSSLGDVLRFHSLRCFTHLTCVLPQGHPLASRTSLSTTDLAGEQLVLLEARQDPIGQGALRDLRYQWVHEQLKRLYPQNYLLASDNITAVTLVKAGFGITLVDSSQITTADGLAFVPLLENHFFEYGVFFRRQNVNPAISRFFEMAEELYTAPMMFGPARRLRPLAEFASEHPDVEGELGR